MKTENFHIGSTPAVLYGEPSPWVFLYIRGQGGNKKEAARYVAVATLLYLRSHPSGGSADTDGTRGGCLPPELTDEDGHLQAKNGRSKTVRFFLCTVFRSRGIRDR